jgi:hypothetical protein
VVVNDKFGIRLTDIITPAERIRKLNLMKLPSILTFSGLALTCQSVFVAEAVSTPATGFLQTVLALLFVIALMLALAWVMKRVSRCRGSSNWA